MAAPLYSLTGSLARKIKFVWQACHQEAFEKLIGLMISAPVMRIPDRENPFVLDTDASDLAIGTEYAGAYGSAALNASQKVYCITRKELLAIVKFVCHFKIRTDHHILAWLLRFKQAYGQLARWLEELSQYDFTIEYRPGKEHSYVDFLSRFGSECPSVGEALKGLPCGGCLACHRAARKWLSFSEEVDDTIPLLRIRNVKFGPEEPRFLLRMWPVGNPKTKASPSFTRG